MRLVGGTSSDSQQDYYLQHLLNDLVSASQGFHKGSCRDQGPLDRGGHLARNVPKRSQVVDVLGHARQVETVEGVLGVQHLGVGGKTILVFKSEKVP